MSASVRPLGWRGLLGLVRAAEARARTRAASRSSRVDRNPSMVGSVGTQVREDRKKVRAGSRNHLIFF